MMVSHDGPAVVGVGRDVRCAAVAGPCAVCVHVLTVDCVRLSQDRIRDCN